MKIIKKVFNLKRKEYYLKHFNIVNSLLPQKLKDKEIELLCHFMLVDIRITENDMFNSVARKKVMESMKISCYSLSNYISSLYKKNILLRNKYTNKLFINKNLLPDDNIQEYQIKLIKDESSNQ